ncbi:hypothetical protein BH23GEM9_BH23GEM9_19800 [soil metagenome]
MRTRVAAGSRRNRPGSAIRFQRVRSACAVACLAAMTAPSAALSGAASANRDCAEAVRLVRQARSLAELKSLIQARRLTEATLRQCAEELGREPRLAELIQLERQPIRAYALQQAQLESSAASRSPEALRINERVFYARQLARTRLSLLLTEPPATERRDPAPPPPSIGSVTPSPVVPGTDIVIEGTSLGTSVGTVRLKLQGKTFNATVNYWTDSWISAFISDNISGVTETSVAVLEVQPGNGQAITRMVSFVPIYERLVVSDVAFPLFSWPFPGERTQTYAEQWSLASHWRVAAAPWVTTSGGITCEISGPPVANSTSSNLATRIYTSWGWWETPSCILYFEIEGPRGFSNGLW